MKPEKIQQLFGGDLQPGETIIASLKAATARNESKKHETMEMPPADMFGGLALTNRRFLFIGKFMFQKTSRSIPLAQVTGIELDMRMIHTLLRLTIAGGQALFVIHDTNNEAKAFVVAANIALAEPLQVSSPSSVSNTGDSTHSVLERLSHLGQLRDTGVVTTEEFEKLKSDILAGEPSNVSVVTGGAISEAQAAEADKHEFTVILTSVGAQKIQVIKVVRELTNRGLRGAKDLVDGAPNPILEGVSEDHANLAKAKLESAGAVVEIR